MDSFAHKLNERTEPFDIAVLYEASEAGLFGITLAGFVEIVRQAVRASLGSEPSVAEAAKLQERLHIKDLVLAQACAAGHERAWERFLFRYKEKLFAAACAIAKDPVLAQELVDSLYSDLFGVKEIPKGQRHSKLALYTGRGSLEGWLKATLAQSYVDRYRRQRRLVSLEEHLGSIEAVHSNEFLESRSADPRLDEAIRQSFLSLRPEDRFVLASYFFDGRTLGQIAIILGVHESTVSRRIDKITRSLRKSIIHRLKKAGMSTRAAADSLQTDIQTLSVDIRSYLIRGMNAAR